MTAIPFEELDRSPWPKAATALGYRIGPAKAADLEFARSAYGPLGNDPEASWREGNPDGAPLYFSAVHEASHSLHAFFELQIVIVRTGDSETRYGRIATAWMSPSAIVAGDPPLLVRLVMAAFKESCGPKDIATVFGIPGYAHQLLGRKPGAPGHALGYEVMRTEMALAMETDKFAGGLGYLPQLDGGVRPFDAQVLSTLALVTTKEHHGSCRKNAAYLDWRYAQRPGSNYEMISVGPVDNPVAAALVTIKPEHLGGGLCIAEWWAKDHDYDSGLALLRHLILRAQELGKSMVVAPFGDTLPWFHHFQWHGFMVYPIPEVSLAKTFVRAQDIAWCRTAWALTPGDLFLA